MKLFRLVRSIGAIGVGSAMLLCNVPLVRGGDVVVEVEVKRSDDAGNDGNVRGNGTLITKTDDEGKITIINPGGMPLSGPSNSNSVSVVNRGSEYIGKVEGNVYGGESGFTDTTANGNAVLVESGASVTGNVYGGSLNSTNGNSASGNTVNIQGKVNALTGKKVEVVGGVLNGSSASNKEVRYNTVEIYSGADVTADVYGGRIVGGDAIDNWVIVAAGQKGDVKVTGDVTGGDSNSGNVTNNIVVIDASAKEGHLDIDGAVYGGHVGSGAVTGNGVVVTKLNDASASVHVKEAYGMYRDTGNSEGNYVSLPSIGTVNKAYAGYTKNGNATENEIIVSGSVTGGGGSNPQNNYVVVEGGSVDSAYAGATGNGNATQNRIFANNGQTDNSLYGGYSEHGNATDNKASIKGNAGDIYVGYAVVGNATNNVADGNGNAGNVYGGYIENGKNASENRIDFRRGNVKNIYGGYAKIQGDATNNEIVVAGDDPTVGVNVSENIYGGYVEGLGAANENIVTIKDNARVLGDVTGGLSKAFTTDSGNGTAVKNEVRIERGAIVAGGVYGGHSGAATDNHVYIEGGNVSGETVGGFADGSDFYTKNNTVEIKSGNTGAVYGGKIAIGNTEDNTVSITGGTAGDIYGGSAGMGHAKRNIVEIDGGKIGNVYGGRSTGSATGEDIENTVTLKNSNAGDVYGAYDNYGDVSTNKVVIDVDSKVGSVSGGHTSHGVAKNNTIDIVKSTVNGAVVEGGFSDNGDVSGNKVTIEDSQITNGAATITGGQASAGTAVSNSVTISGNNSIVTVKSVTGGNSSGNATENKIEIGVDGGEFDAATVVGGYSGSGSATKNMVTIYRGIYGEVVGGQTKGTGNAENNTVNLHSGTYTDVYGGRSDGDGYARNNTVNLYGGSYKGAIYGGYSNAGAATGNTIHIFGNATLASDVLLYGGHAAPGREARAGNTLNLEKRIAIAGLDNFENYNFILPANFAAGEALVTVSGGNGNEGAIHLNGATVRVGAKGATLKSGDTVVLIDEKGGFGFDGNPANSATDGSGLPSSVATGLIKYNFGLQVTGDQLLAKIGSVESGSVTKPLAEGYVSGLILINQGADAIAGSVMDSAMAAAHKGPSSGIGAFGSLIAGKTKYKTGSHVDMTGIAAAAGLVFGHDFTNSSLTLGPFVEYGKGDYDSYGVVGAQEFQGEGDAELMGGGVLFRLDYKDTGIGRYFAEASFRAGKADNNFTVNGLVAPDTEQQAISYSYKSSAPYYGFHMGYGGGWGVTQSTSVEAYGKYFWTRGDKDTVSLSGSEIVDPQTMDFQKVSSSRIRGGARFAFAPGEQFAASFGGAYEYEMDGKTEGAVSALAIDAPALKGGTGIGDVVISYKPSIDRAMSFNFGVQGYAGKRQGVTGSVFVRF